jgi:serine/threonine protein kinase
MQLIIKPASSSLLPMGATLQGRYIIKQVVQHGGMGNIYLASDQRFSRRDCAIKEMIDDFTNPNQRADAVRRFQQEADLLANLSHPNILDVYDRFTEGQRHYLVTPFITGRNLLEHIAELGGATPENTVVEWAITICDVLEYLHAQNPPVIYRDLKPENLMLTATGRLIMIDFGIARHFVAGKPGTMIGTPGYAAPEQYQGMAEPRSDLYALGTTMHHLLTGIDPRKKAPFLFEQVRKVQPALSAGIERIVDKLVQMRIDQRYQTASEVKQDLMLLSSGKTLFNVEWGQSVTAAQSVNLFQIDYQFLNPYLAADTDALCRFLLDFHSAAGIDSYTAKPKVHLVLVLDVSGSMNAPEKYPILIEATEVLIDALDEDDTLSIILFSQGWDAVVSRQRAAICKSEKNIILSEINQSNVKFGQSTILAPAIQVALSEIKAFQRQVSTSVVNRLYILTDGQIHDAEECKQLSKPLQQSGAEVNSYGFGKDFALESLKAMMKGCHGGLVKPIINTQDAVMTFGHIADVSQKIIALDAVLEVAFSKHVICGDAFRYRPGLYYFGNQVYDQNKVFRTSLGVLEAERNYSFCFESRLQPCQEGTEPIAVARLSYLFKGQRMEDVRLIQIVRSRDTHLITRENEQVKQIFAVLEGLRSLDLEQLLEAYRARLALAVQERRDPALIETLRKAIGALETNGSIEGLSATEQRVLKADEKSHLLYYSPLLLERDK